MTRAHPAGRASRRRVRGAACLAALALVAGACTRGEPESREEVLDRDVTEPAGARVDGGSVVFGHEHEPVVLNPLLVEGNLRSTVMATRPVLSGAYMVTPDFRYVPDLLAGEAEPAGGSGDEPFTVTWRIREEAVWSDGTPVSAEDLAFTYRTMTNEEWDIETLLRAGFEDITATEVVDAKTWRATFARVFAPYRTMFETVLPAHVLEGQDFNEVWNDGIVDPGTGEPIGSGPFLLDGWEDDQLTLVRNPRFWGEPANLDEITFRYDEDVPSLLALLTDGDIDLYLPQQPLPAILDRLRATDDLEVQVAAGPVWEHLAFNFSNELLAQRAVREAIIRAIDREELVDALLGDVHPDATVLQDPVYMENQDEHAPTFDRYPYDPQAAVTLLEDHGCAREDEQDGFTCDGQALELRYLSTAGNERRRQLFQVISADLRDVGIALVDDLSPPGEALRQRLPEGDFDVVNFAWVGSPDPYRTGSIFACDGALNHTSYCNEEVSTLIATGTGVLDGDERAAAYNEASRLLAEDIALVPLFQLPEALALSDRIGGVRLNPTQWGPTWNASEWFLTE